MYEPQLNQKTIMHMIRAKKEVNPLDEDIINKVRKISVEPNNPMVYVSTWVNSSLSQLSSEFEKVKDEPKKTVTHASTTIRKVVGNGLSQYNAKSAEVVNKLPGSVAEKASEYLWVSISLALMAGFLLRGLLKDQRK